MRNAQRKVLPESSSLGVHNIYTYLQFAMRKTEGFKLKEILTEITGRLRSSGDLSDLQQSVNKGDTGSS
jgi:hypothetical protein